MPRLMEVEHRMLAEAEPVFAKIGGDDGAGRLSQPEDVDRAALIGNRAPARRMLVEHAAFVIAHHRARGQYSRKRCGLRSTRASILCVPCRSFARRVRETKSRLPHLGYPIWVVTT
jgi:hypothetical protein